LFPIDFELGVSVARFSALRGGTRSFTQRWPNIAFSCLLDRRITNTLRTVYVVLLKQIQTILSRSKFQTSEVSEGDIGSKIA